MKIKKYVILILAMIIGVIPIIFAGCGGVDSSNIAIELTSQADGIDDNLKVVNLSVDENNSRELLFSIANWQDGISAGVNFSTDSQAIEISDKTYLENGAVKIKVTAKQGGSAIITATTQQYSKQTNVMVKVSEKIKDFNLKTNVGTIYFEKGSSLKLNIEDLIAFSPNSTTERDLKAYIDEQLITNEQGETIITGLEADSTITFVSDKLEGVSRNLFVKVVEKLVSTDIGFEKMMLTNSAGTSFEEIQDGDTIPIIKGNYAKSINGVDVGYNERQIRVRINCNQEGLKVRAKIYTKDGENWVLNELLVLDTVQTGVLIEGKYDHIFKLAYNGYDDMKVVFTYLVNDYEYSAYNELYFKVYEAPNNLSLNKNSNKNQEITVYDISDKYVGKKILFEVYPKNSVDFEISLLLNNDANNLLNITDSKGNNKARESITGEYVSKVLISNNETINISATNLTTLKFVTITIETRFTFEGVTYAFTTSLKVNLKRSPTAVVVSDYNSANGLISNAVENYTNYRLDLNSTGKVVNDKGELVQNYGTNSHKFYIYAVLDGVLESGHDFVISSNLGIIDIKRKDNNEIEIVAKSVGVGNFSIILDNGVLLTFRVEVIESLANVELSFPTPSQNSNIFSNILSEQEGFLYDIVAYTGVKIPPIIVKSGSVISYNFISDGFVYSNWYIIGEQDTDDFVECSFVVEHIYLDAQNKAQTQITTIKFRMLFYSQITNFMLSTNKGSTSFDLYNLLNAGYYSSELATAIITLNVEPAILKSMVLENVDWSSNIEWTNTDAEGEDVNVYSNDVFTFKFNKKTGIGTLVCNIEKAKQEEYINQRIALVASYERKQDGKVIEKFTKSVQFDIINSTPIDEIVTSIDNLYIDSFKGSVSIYTTVYPLDASNKNLRAIFIPEDLSYANALSFTWENSKLVVSLDERFNTGEGIIRIIALDSYTASDTYSKFVDVPITICDGSEEYPYQIVSENDLNILIKTGFSKNYEIIGTIDISKYPNWEYSKYELTGSIKGVNNACITGIKVEKFTEGYAGLFKSIAQNAKIQNIKFEGSINLLNIGSENDSQQVNIGLIAGENNGEITDISVKLLTSNLSLRNNYSVNLGGLFGVNNGTIKLTEELNEKLIDFENIFTVNDFTATETAENYSFTLYIGGVVGYNSGLIKKLDESNLTQVIVKFDITSNASRTTSYIGIGGIAGICYAEDAGVGTELGIKNINIEGKIIAGKNEGNKFIGHFDNVGGIVGNNTLSITNVISQVIIKGRQNVGGGVGYNNGGNLQEVKIQSREIDDCILIVGNNNVGGIIGYFASGQIAKSTFISYVSKAYIGDIIVYSTSDVTLNAGRIAGLLGTNCTIEYAISIVKLYSNDNINLVFNDKTDKIVIFGTIKINETSEEKTFIDGNFLNSLTNNEDNQIQSGINNLQEFIDKIVEYEQAGGGSTSFIILAPTIITTELTDKGNNHKLTSNATDEKIVFYLQLHQESVRSISEAFSLLNKYKISDYITVKANSNTSLIYTSSYESKLKIY